VRGMAAVLALLSVVAAASANTYTVTKKANLGTGTLRWAIEQANAHVGPDQIRFASELSGAVILPRAPLPPLTDDRTTINGDINGDHVPDVAINGKNALPPFGPGPVDGLSITGRRCVVRGLAVVAFSGSGIALTGTRYCQVVGCYLGVNLQGTQTKPLGQSGVSVVRGGYNSIGGASAAERNVFGPSANLGYGGVLVYRSSANTVSGNYFGLAPDGMQVLGSVAYGVFVNGLSGPSEDNVIGGEDPGAGNVFGGCHWGAVLEGATNTQILGNLFGLKADGDTLAPVSTCVSLGTGTTGTQIGGTTDEVRNVFASAPTWYAIHIHGLGTADNVIQGNYFGTNQDGTKRRRLGGGISIWDGAGWQLIGGAKPAAGNHFLTFSPDLLCEAISIGGPASAKIRSNSFGLLPAGGGATGINNAIFVHSGGTARVLDNTITNAAGRGVWVIGAASQAFVFGNVFRNCYRAVAVTHNATCSLGNLGNVNNDDDGGNQFKPSNTWTIWNTTPSTVKAEGNDFDTTSMSAIDAKIYDLLDCPSTGRVDFVPLIGNVIPTGGSSPAVVLTGVAAMPTSSGAEIAFTLSAPADVTVSVLNLAGRPVATVVHDQAGEAGTQRVVWSGQTLNGTPASAGTYLVRIAARRADGQQTTALCTLRLAR
jgi:hypothetical protein